MPRFLEMFRPGERVASVLDIDPNALGSSGIETVMLDLDNTLLPWQSSIVPDDVRAWIESIKQAGLKTCIVSNTHNPRRLTKISDDLDILSLPRALKPRRYGFAKAAEILCTDLSRSVVVGDQLLTDILGGNLAGARTILVRPMHPREFFGTKISRVVEFGILMLLGKQSPAGTK